MNQAALNQEVYDRFISSLPDDILLSLYDTGDTQLQCVVNKALISKVHELLREYLTDHDVISLPQGITYAGLYRDMKRMHCLRSDIAHWLTGTISAHGMHRLTDYACVIGAKHIVPALLSHTRSGCIRT